MRSDSTWTHLEGRAMRRRLNTHLFSPIQPYSMHFNVILPCCEHQELWEATFMSIDSMMECPCMLSFVNIYGVCVCVCVGVCLFLKESASLQIL